jgi:hypothetical protein
MLHPTMPAKRVDDFEGDELVSAIHGARRGAYSLRPHHLKLLSLTSPSSPGEALLPLTSSEPGRRSSNVSHHQCWSAPVVALVSCPTPEWLLTVGEESSSACQERSRPKITLRLAPAPENAAPPVHPEASCSASSGQNQRSTSSAPSSPQLTFHPDFPFAPTLMVGSCQTLQLQPKRAPSSFHSPCQHPTSQDSDQHRPLSHIKTRLVVHIPRRVHYRQHLTIPFSQECHSHCRDPSPAPPAMRLGIPNLAKGRTKPDGGAVRTTISWPSSSPLHRTTTARVLYPFLSPRLAADGL